MRFSLDWQAWALLSALFAGLTAVFAKVGVEKLNSDFATLIRSVCIVVLLWAFVMATSQWQPLASISKRSLLFLILSAMATGASWVCYFRALQLSKVSLVAPVDKLSVGFVAVFAFLFLGERLSGFNWLGIGLIAGGAALLTLRP